MKRISLFLIMLSIIYSCNNGTPGKKNQTECANNETTCTKNHAGCKKNVCRMNVASFNLRMNTNSDSINAWPNRKEHVKDLIRFHDFDIFGTQEGFKEMLDGIAELPEYVWIGEGRDGGDNGEHSAIVYKKDRFTLLDQGNFWYSETPDKIGLGWDATCCNRICSWGKFKDNISGKEFFFFDSHFDHQGVIARRESAKLLNRKIREIAGNLPVFATGDYNATPESEPIQTILSDGLLKDAFAKSEQKPYGTTGTFHGFNRVKTGYGRIDFIFLTDNIRVKRYGTINDWTQYDDKYPSAYPSDHFPILATVEF